MKTILKTLIPAVFIGLPFFKAEARIVLPQFITDSMVIQQKSRIIIKGKASGDVNVKASWSKSSQSVKTDAHGQFAVTLNTPKAGGPFTISFEDEESTTTLRDVYSGEVWLCSGQSNMEMPVGGWGKVQNYEWEIANANYSDIRFLQIKKQIAYRPADDTQVNMGGWRTCSPQTVENFSSIAYFYAREMAKKLNVHVGVIDCSWGGTPAEAWTSFAGVEKVVGFENELKLMRENDCDRTKMNAGYERQLNEWMKLTNSSDVDFDKTVYHGAWATMPIPCEWEKSVLGEFDGIVWLQCRFKVPNECEGKPLELNLGMIDDEDVTYYNGAKIAKGSGYNTPRHYTVPADLVKAGEAVVTVRVSDFGGGGGIWGDPAGLTAKSGDTKIALAGNWAYKVASDFSKLPAKPISVESSSFPTTLYNAMLYPLHTMPIKGVLWYQGCANVGRDAQYSELFRQLITDWRTLWNDEQLPFYFVQLAGYLQPKAVQYDSQWAALRQAQADALALKRTKMAVAIDIGDPDDIHPKNKQEVARRLALIAQHDAYGNRNVVAEAPMLKKCSLTADGKAILTFTDKVIANGEAPKGFIAKLADGSWVAAKAEIVKDRSIRISAKAPIVEVRYDWADYPDGNITGVTNLPVAPFKTR